MSFERYRGVLAGYRGNLKTTETITKPSDYPLPPKYRGYRGKFYSAWITWRENNQANEIPDSKPDSFHHRSAGFPLVES